MMQEEKENFYRLLANCGGILILPFVAILILGAVIVMYTVAFFGYTVSTIKDLFKYSYKTLFHKK